MGGGGGCSSMLQGLCCGLRTNRSPSQASGAKDEEGFFSNLNQKS